MINKINTIKQKLIITGLITSNEFCKEIIPILNYNRELTNEIFSNYYKVTLNWCIDYYKKYNKSPKRYIQKIYKNSYEKAEYDDEDYKLIEEFLNNLSDKFERDKNYNEQYTIDQALLFLREVNLKILKKQISDVQDIATAERAVEEFRHIKKETDQIESFDLFNDLTEIDDAFNEEKDNLFKLPGILGNTCYYFQRGDLISFTAPAKRGKTWALQEIAILALLNHLRVVFFSFEMSKKQCKKRLYQSLLAEVKRIKKGQESIEVKIPKFSYDSDIEKYIIDYNVKEKYGISADKVKNKLKAIKTQARGGNLKVICPPAYSMSVRQSERILDDMVLDGFVPDVVIYDYADIIEPERKNEYRHQIDSVWKGLKRVAQKKHIAVFTASHSNKTTFEKDINEGDVVEDSRKLNHVSIMMAINQKAEEKKLGLARLSILVHRHEDFNKTDNFVILQNLSIGKFMLDNKFEKDVHYELPKKKRR